MIRKRKNDRLETNRKGKVADCESSTQKPNRNKIRGKKNEEKKMGKRVIQTQCEEDRNKEDTMVVCPLSLSVIKQKNDRIETNSNTGKFKLITEQCGFARTAYAHYHHEQRNKTNKAKNMNERKELEMHKSRQKQTRRDKQWVYNEERKEEKTKQNKTRTMWKQATSSKQIRNHT